MRKILFMSMFMVAFHAQAGGAMAIPVVPIERGLNVCVESDPRFTTCVKRERIPWEVVGAFMEKTGKRTFEDEEIRIFYQGWKAAQTKQEEK